jgi:hypothetical protein
MQVFMNHPIHLYSSKWFCVTKKDGKSLCIVHSLEPLNKVSIKHAGVTPFTDQLREHTCKVSICVNSSIGKCFDCKDKELYDLWV